MKPTAKRRLDALEEVARDKWDTLSLAVCRWALEHATPEERRALEREGAWVDWSDEDLARAGEDRQSIEDWRAAVGPMREGDALLRSAVYSRVPDSLARAVRFWCIVAAPARGEG